MKALRLLFAFGACAVLISCQPHTDMLPFASPESVGMSSKRLELLDAAVESGIQRGDFPGAVVLVARKGRCVWRKSYGDSQTVPEKIPMEVSMIFDVASITKPVATATSLMILLEQGRIRLWDRVRDYVPEFTSCKGPETQPVDEARIWHLLTHTSGLPPYADPEEVKKAVEHPVTLEQLVSYIARMEKPYPPGERFQYSCLGYITLGYIIEKISGKTLAEFARENIFKPLGMRDTAFAPSEDLRSRCVPTLVIDGKPLVGEVHDPLARLLGGVSGNAGLFSTADDLAVYGQMLLQRGKWNGVRILSPLSVDRMTEIYESVGFSGRGLGWDIRSSYATNKGDLFGPEAFGHTGYTGTSLVVDPSTQTIIVFLTNRVHPDDTGDVVSLRSRVANIVASAIIEDP